MDVTRDITYKRLKVFIHIKNLNTSNLKTEKKSQTARWKKALLYKKGWLIFIYKGLTYFRKKGRQVDKQEGLKEENILSEHL